MRQMKNSRRDDDDKRQGEMEEGRKKRCRTGSGVGVKEDWRMGVRVS